jgi:predicted ArsR family transcriptional regulator
MEDKKKEIIEFLNKMGRLSASRFVGLLGINYEQVKKLLEELEKEGMILKEIETNSTYYTSYKYINNKNENGK